MKNLYVSALILITIAFSSCGKGDGRGELVGVKNKTVKQELPYGMVYIPAGTFVMGQVDQDITISQFPQNKQVTISAFYMDETEISNSEYKQFVNWVRDSIAFYQVGKPAKYLLKSKGKASTYINWKAVNSKKGLWGDKTLKDKLEKAMYYDGNEKFFNKKELKVEQLKYDYAWVDYKKAAAYRGARDPNLNKNGISVSREEFIVKEETYIYPDTLVWISDFTYAQNDPMAKGYFSHPSFANYPVVGVTWEQANAFNMWRSRLNESYKDSKKMTNKRLDYELPTEAQFEYAARGGRVQTSYPWGGPYIRNAKGCLLANFKPGRGNYIDDGGAFTVYVKSYFPNDYGLYNMAGNVAEWTSSIYSDAATAYVSTINPSFNKAVKKGDPDYNKKRVVKGGSWKDIGYFLQNSAKSYEYPDSARSSIGFRCVTPFLGRDIKDKPGKMKP
ncbi:MAG: SUMF1/EgtB/PvdO family nonheme iron enzyme [Oligoflexus sp.]|jgi:gliding motility-associated lipoprotein GldK|nr:SUMF1/EgtB/PvdO family nonheme iron enzyme [Pseudopedobacter sp.]